MLAEYASACSISDILGKGLSVGDFIHVTPLIKKNGELVADMSTGDIS